MTEYLRQAEAQDEEFLYALFAEEKAAQLAMVCFNNASLDALIQMQYHGQQMSYAARFPQAQNHILLDEDGRPAGRLLLDRQAKQWRVVDIGVLAAHRGKGLATRALRHCQQQCAAAGLALALQVTPWNPARCLYERLGFGVLDEDEMSVEMMWLPAGVEVCS